MAEITPATSLPERAVRDWYEGQLIAEGNVRGQVLRGRDESNSLGNAAIQRLVDAHLVRANVYIPQVVLEGPYNIVFA